MTVIVKNATGEPYCVYGHFSLDDECLYVGSGYLKRAFEFVKDRGDKHSAVLAETEITVVILHQCSDRAAATALEKQLIKLLLPKYNIQMCKGEYSKKEVVLRREERERVKKQRNAERARKARERRSSSWSRVSPIRCVETRRYFYGSAHAGRAMNLGQSRISATLLGKCSSVDGFHFVKATWEESGLDRTLVGKPKQQDEIF